MTHWKKLERKFAPLIIWFFYLQYEILCNTRIHVSMYQSTKSNSHNFISDSLEEWQKMQATTLTSWSDLSWHIHLQMSLHRDRSPDFLPLKPVSLNRMCFDLSSSISMFLLVLNKELINHQESSSVKLAHSSRSVRPLQRAGNPTNYWPADKTGFVWETHSCTLTRMN